jgi:hypothetical protein
MEPEVINIVWEGPLTLDEVIALKTNYNEDCGLYQLYSVHPIYGPGALIYIGKTTENHFSGRIREHKDWLEDLGPSAVYLGRIEDVEEDEWEGKVEKAERMLLYSHWPAANGMGVGSIDLDSYSNVRILNCGKCGLLMPEVSKEEL